MALGHIGLDAVYKTNTGLVYDLFRSINEQTGTAFIIVTHDRNVAQRTDRILEVRDGLLIADERNRYLGWGDVPAGTRRRQPVQR